VTEAERAVRAAVRSRDDLAGRIGADDKLSENDRRALVDLARTALDARDGKVADGNA
jgi:hypothetical protein